MEMYKQYLKQAYSRVVELTLKDESITVLSQMENKSFYFSRIHQLFEDLYSVERENKIRELLQRVESHEINGQFLNQKEKGGQNIKFQQRGEEDLKQISGNYGSLKQNFHLMLKQNERLKKQLQLLSSKELQQMKSLSKVSEANEQKAKKVISSLKAEFDIINDKYQKLLNESSQKQRQFSKLLSSNIGMTETKDRLERKVKELEKEKRTQMQLLQKIKEENLSLKDSVNIFEECMRQNKEQEILYKQKIMFLQNEINKIAERNEIGLEEKTKSCEIKQEQGNKLKQKEFRNLISTLTLKQLEIRNILKQKDSLVRENSNIAKQMQEVKQYSDRIIQQLRQAFASERAEMERQLRKYRNGERQALIEMKKAEVKDRNGGWQALEERNRILQNEKTKLQNKLVKAENANKMMLQNYEHITKAFKQQKSLYDLRIQQNDRKVEQIQKSEKSLVKRLQLLEKEYKNLETEKKQKVEYYEQKINCYQSELDQIKKSESSIKKSYQKLERQYNQEIKKNHNSKNLGKQYELNIRINQLQVLLQQSKYASNSLIQKKEEKVKNVKKQYDLLSQKLLQVNMKFQKEQDERRKQQSKVKELERIVKQQQQDFGAKEESHRNQIIELMRSNQVKREQLVDQLTRHYSSSMKQSNASQQKYVSQTLKQIEQEYKQRIKNFEEDLQSFKQKNAQLLNKNLQLVEKYEEQSNKYKNICGQVEQRAVKERQLVEKLQKQKKREIYIVRSYQDRINKMKYLFRQIKFELCNQFLAANNQLKNELMVFNKDFFRLSESHKKQIWEIKISIQQKISSYLNQKDKRIEQLEKKGANGAKLEYFRQKEEIILSYQGKLKSKHLQMMTMLAEKQFMLEQVRQKQENNSKKSKQVQAQYRKVLGKMQRLEKAEVELKDIIEKMEYKVDEAQKGMMAKQKQVCKLIKLNEDLQNSIAKLETSNRVEIKEMRQKYRQQNDRLFGRYEKQFNKMISLNSKKIKDKGSLTSLGSNIGSLIPTKGNEEDKVEKLKKQIQDQKRMIQQMESQRKF